MSLMDLLKAKQYKEENDQMKAVLNSEQGQEGMQLAARLQQLREQVQAQERDLLDATRKKADVLDDAFGEDIYKIGMTRRLDPLDRIDELSSASVPFHFDVHALIFSKDAVTLETKLHQAFERKKLNLVNGRKEFFHVSLDEIKQEIMKNYDKTVEFVDVPEATQYRQSEQMRKYMEEA